MIIGKKKSETWHYLTEMLSELDHLKRLHFGLIPIDALYDAVRGSRCR